MRKWITLLMTCLVVGSYANANTGQVNLEAGYRRDNISWKNRIPSDDPVFSSSHRFEDLDIFQLGVNARSTLGCNFYVRANAYWGWILDGDYKRRAEFNENFSDNWNEGRRGEIKSVIDDKYVYGVGAAVGYPFYFCDCTTVIAPVIGYSFDEQSVQLDTKGFNNFNDDCYDSFSGCNGGDCCRQTFNSRWYGPFVGVDFNYRPYCSCWNIYADLEFHWGDFRGRRNGDEDFEFDGNQRSHDARGWVFAAGAEYDLCNCWTVGFSVKFQDWSANRHHHHDGFSDGYNGFHGRARNNNKWHSAAVNLTVGKEF